MCAVLTTKMSEDDLATLATNLVQRLGGPTSADQVKIRIGEQGGSLFPLVLEGPSGSVELAVLSYLGWYRVSA